MLSRKGFVLGTAAVALVGLSVSAIVGWNSHRPGSVSDAAWAFPLGGENLIRYAHDIVVAEPVAVHPGKDVVSESGDHAMRFEIVELKVTAGLKGARAGDAVFVERAAAIVEGDRVSSVVVDGGPFLNGTELLFLRQQPDGAFAYVVNDLSRYAVSAGGVLSPVGDAEADLHRGSFAGKTLDEVDLLVKETLKK